MRNPTSKAVWGAVVALALLWPASAVASAGQSGKLDRALQEASSSGGPRNVIIRVRAGRKAAVKTNVDRRTTDSRVHGLIDAVTARLSPGEIDEIANDPDVESVSIDADVTVSGRAGEERDRGDKKDKRKKIAGSQETSATDSNEFSSSSNVVADVKRILGLGNGYSGSSITVALIDSGIALSADFDTRILAQYVFSNGKPAVYSVPYDDYGHGTHVAGLIGSSGASSGKKYAGIVPGVRLLSLKVLDKRGSGKTSDVINALEFAVANKARFGIKVVNLSLGHPIYESATTDPLVQAVEAAVRAGIVVVVAAGNYGSNPLTGKTGYAGVASPGNAPSAITVGAAVTGNTVTRTDDRLADYSSRGPSWYDGIAKPDVLAPGQGLVSNDALGSTLDRNYPSLVVRSGSTRYLRLSGSSMATGVVAGLAALMLEANRSGAQEGERDYENWLKRAGRSSLEGPPGLSSNALKALLQYSATPLRDGAGMMYGPLEQGAGLVNGAGAVSLAANIDTRKGTGEYWLAAEIPAYTTFGGAEEAWSGTVIWGTRLLRGTSVVDLRQAAWASNVVWGTGELDNIVSGTVSATEDNIVWGTLLNEDNIVWGTNLSLTTDLTWAGNASLEFNIVWGTTAATWAQNVVWGTNLVGSLSGTNIVWGTFSGDEDNIVWGTLSEDNIVWGTSANKVSVLGTTIGSGL